MPSPEGRTEEPTAGERQSADPGAEELFSPALLEYARSGLDRAWREQRGEAIPPVWLEQSLEEFRTATLALPASIGEQNATIQSQREAETRALKAGDALALVQLLQDTECGPYPDLVGSTKNMQALFSRTVAPAVVSGPEYRPDWQTPLAAGSLLDFPAGVFPLQNVLHANDPKTANLTDITIRGKGLEHTLLVLDSYFYSSAPIRNLKIEDCTLHCNSNYLFDLRLEGLSLTMNRVRLIGFDMGAGSSCAFSTEGLALLARDCTFETGYGRHPQFAQLFDVRHNGLIARFENCRILGPELDFPRERWSLVFDRCTLEISDRFRSYLDGRNSGIRAVGCEITLRPEATPKDLNLLFPDWQARLQAARR
ncbi:MAG: hypothetical protein R3F17_03295 [Planctomycetota bacterium]